MEGAEEDAVEEDGHHVAHDNGAELEEKARFSEGKGKQKSREGGAHHGIRLSWSDIARRLTIVHGGACCVAQREGGRRRKREEERQSRRQLNSNEEGEEADLEAIASLEPWRARIPLKRCQLEVNSMISVACSPSRRRPLLSADGGGQSSEL